MASTYTPKIDDRFRITMKYLQSLHQQLSDAPKSDRERWVAKDILAILNKYKGINNDG